MENKKKPSKASNVFEFISFIISIAAIIYGLSFWI